MTVQATFAATLVDEWARAGVGHAVVAPGSRSTPLAVALAADERIRVLVHHDERSAGFLGLGIGLAGAGPAVVVTTSGTAAVELHPAVVEASQAGIPLLACTADRPPELHDVGAPQTIDQTHLYGRAVRWFAAPGVPEEHTAGSWRSLASRAVLEATGTRPGPVHLNLAFRDPLVGDAGPLPLGRAGGRPWHTRGGDLADTAVAFDPAGLDADRGVLVAGGGASAAVSELGEELGWPVLADPRSACRLPSATTVAAFDALLRHDRWAHEHRPDVVVRVGEPPASKVLAQWLAASGAHHVVVHRPGPWLDPERTAAAVVATDPAAWCDVALAWARHHRADDRRWLGAWQRAEAVAQRAIDATLAVDGRLTEPAVARGLAAALPDGTALVVSSSMPVRDVEWYACPRPGMRVLANRGANGIDGVVSTAVGVAIATGGPTALLIGDVAFLHDTNGLLGLAGRGVDLTIVVVDNRGGGIFSFLPQRATLPGPRFEQLFGTPHAVDLVALSQVHGVGGTRVVDPDGFDAAVRAATGSGGTHVVVVSTDRATVVGDHDRIHHAVADALDEVQGSTT